MRIFAFAVASAVLGSVALLAGCGRDGGSGDGSVAELRFHSFDGGGPEYKIIIDDPSVLTYEYRKEYIDPNHEELNGAGFTVIFTLRGLAPGKTLVTVRSSSPIIEEEEERYTVEVDDKLHVTAVPAQSADDATDGDDIV